MNIRARVEYDGAAFHGFQKQPVLRTVQGEIEGALFEMFNENIRVLYASRTDAGVNSIAQVISFSVDTGISVADITERLNRITGDDIRIKDTALCQEDFNPRYDVKEKTYTYTIVRSPEDRSDFVDNMWNVKRDLDFVSIKHAAAMMQGRHDFSLFTSEKKRNADIDMHRVTAVRSDNRITIEFVSRYFLTYMVRYLTGYIVAIGKGQGTLETLSLMLEGKGRLCPYCAPAQGLQLTTIIY